MKLAGIDHGITDWSKVEQTERKYRMQCTNCCRYERIETVVYKAPQDEASVVGQVRAVV